MGMKKVSRISPVADNQKNSLPSMIFRIMIPSDACILIPIICEYVALYSKGDFADVSEFRILRQNDKPGISWRIQCNYKGPYNKKVRVSESERELCQWKGKLE